MQVPERYWRNMNTLSAEECLALGTKRVCVIGCGGLGGHIIDTLCRLGVGHLTVCDGDVFELSNLNRQLTSNEGLIGCSKALAAKRHVEAVNSGVTVTAVCERFTAENGEALIRGHDLVMDALDSIATRRLLQEVCERVNVPMVHGAVSGWNGQVSVIFPGDRSLDKIYPSHAGDEPYDPARSPGNPSFIPPFVAALQCAEAVKVLLGRGGILRRRLMFSDLQDHKCIIIDL
jgi:molybdopterin/thiamine biosynthesis adenylyltransferase